MLTGISIPTSCLTETWQLSDGGLVLGNESDDNCWPGTRGMFTTISPAICPEGYVSACNIDGASRRDESETIWACCPSGFHCDGGTWKCALRLTKDQTYVVTDTMGSPITTYLSDGMDVNAHSIRVAFHSSDIMPAITPGPVLPSSLSTATPVTASCAITSCAMAPDPNPQTLPPGAWVGIGIGSTLGALIFLAAILWLWRRQLGGKQREVAYTHSIANFSLMPEKKPAIPPAELHGTSGSHELYAGATNDRGYR